MIWPLCSGRPDWRNRALTISRSHLLSTLFSRDFSRRFLSSGTLIALAFFLARPALPCDNIAQFRNNPQWQGIMRNYKPRWFFIPLRAKNRRPLLFTADAKVLSQGRMSVGRCHIVAPARPHHSFRRGPVQVFSSGAAR